MFIDSLSQAAVAGGHIVQAAAPAGGGGGILDWLNLKGTEAMVTVRILGSLAAVGSVLYSWYRARFAAVALIIAGLVAGLAVWILFNVTKVSDRVGNEVDSVGRVTVTNSAAPASATPVTATSPPPGS